jgi:hypothetical protein
MEKQKPSLGRIVKFHNPHSGKIEPALIVAVHSDENVNLVSWNEFGTQNTHQSVTLGEGPDRWHWPARA